MTKRTQKPNLQWGHHNCEEDDYHLYDRGDSKIKDNHVFFYTSVNERSILELKISLQVAGQNALKIQDRFSLEKTPPVHLHIHSYGGSVFSGFSGVTAIKQCQTEVHTHIEGSCASAATFLSLTGDHRTIAKDSYLMVHQISSDFWGTYENLNDEKDNQDKLMRHIVSFYQRKTKMTKEFLESILKKDLWLNAEEALNLGFVDEIVD